MELLFTSAELEHLQREEVDSDERRRQQQAKEAAEAEALARAQSGGVDTFFIPDS